MSIQTDNCKLPLIAEEKWIADNGASHHICLDKSRFKTLPHSCISSIQTIDGPQKVTQAGTVELIVDGEYGKQTMILENVLLQEESKVHVYSLQQARKQNIYYTFGQATQGKIRLMQQLAMGTSKQVALMTEHLGTWTLDVHQSTTAHSLASLPSFPPSQTSSILQSALTYADMNQPLVALGNSFSGRFDKGCVDNLPRAQLPHPKLLLHKPHEDRLAVETSDTIDSLHQDQVVSPHIFVFGGAVGQGMHNGIDRAGVAAELLPANMVKLLSPTVVLDDMVHLAAADLVLLPTATVQVVL